MDLVTLTQPAQDADRVLDGGLVDLHRLETPFQRRVLLDVLAVFVQRGRADRVQLAAGEHRLEHVRGVERAFGGAGADDGVQLVDEEHDRAVRLGDFRQHGLQTILELAAILGAGDERAHVEPDDALVLEPFGHVAADDALRQALDDGGLADAGLADEHRVVLGAAREHLDDAADLLVAADHRIELVLAGQRGQVAAVALERLVLALGVLVGHALAAADGDERLEHAIVGDAVARQRLGAGRAAGLADQREQQVLGADELVLEAGQLALGLLQHAAQARGKAGVRRAVGLGQLGQLLLHVAADGGRVDLELAQDVGHDAARLRDQRRQEMFGIDLRMLGLFGRALGAGQRFLRLLGEAVDVHQDTFDDDSCSASCASAS